MQQANLQNKAYNLIDCLEMVIKSSSVKFAASVDVAINLNIDARKSEEQVRGVVVLPKGIGKNIKVAVFAKDKYLLEAQEAMVDVVGGEDLINDIKEGKKLNVDWCITTPDFMPSVAPIAKILGSKGLMPNPKFGTVTFEIAKTINIIKSGQIKFRVDKGGTVHAKFGTVQLSAKDLFINFMALMKVIKDAKPVTIKGNYFKSVFISSTMGKSFKVNKVEEIFSKEYNSEA